MNKRGENTESGYTITAVIVALALVVALAIVGLFFAKNIPFFKNLAQPGNETTSVSGIERLRYDILNDKVQYYGEDLIWHNFNGIIDLNEKSVSYSDIHTAFSSYFFNSPRASREVSMDSKGSSAVIIELIQKDSSKINKYSEAKMGDVLVELHGSGESFGGNLGVYLLSIQNNLAFYGTRVEHKIGPIKYWPDTFPETRTAEIMSNSGKLRGEAITWRDSVLNKPMSVTYIDKQNNGAKTINVCVTRIDNNNAYLTIDLIQEVNGNEC